MAPGQTATPGGFSARLRQAITAYGPVTDLARAIGRSEGAVRKWLRRVSEPNVGDLRAICTVTGVNVEWLLWGKEKAGVGIHGALQVPGDVRAHDAPAVDGALLESILEVMDEEILASGAEIATSKRSAMAVTLYSLFQSHGNIDRPAVARLVKLAG